MSTEVELSSEKVGALFPNIRGAIDLIKSPIFHDLVDMVAALQTPGKEDDKAAFIAILKDAGMPEVAAYADPLFDFVIALLAVKTSVAETGPIKLMASTAGPGGRVHPFAVFIARNETARDLMADKGYGYFKARSYAVQAVKSSTISEALAAAGAPVGCLAFDAPDVAEGNTGAMFDGHIIEQFNKWKEANPETWAAIKKFILSLIMALIAM